MSNKTDNSHIVVGTKAAGLKHYFFHLRMSRQMEKNIPLQYTKSFTFKQLFILIRFKDPFLPSLLPIFFQNPRNLL